MLDETEPLCQVSPELSVQHPEPAGTSQTLSDLLLEAPGKQRYLSITCTSSQPPDVPDTDTIVIYNVEIRRTREKLISHHRLGDYRYNAPLNPPASESSASWGKHR